jgi:hypothetical protein
MYSVLKWHNVAKHTDSYGSMWLPMVMQDVSKKLYNFESFYTFIQGTCTVFSTVIM